jgi:hypothetical protein
MQNNNNQSDSLNNKAIAARAAAIKDIDKAMSDVANLIKEMHEINNLILYTISEHQEKGQVAVGVSHFFGNEHSVLIINPGDFNELHKLFTDEGYTLKSLLVEWFLGNLSKPTGAITYKKQATQLTWSCFTLR